MKINKLWTKLKSFIFGESKSNVNSDKNGFSKEEKKETFGAGSIKYKRASAYIPGFYEGNSENGWQFKNKPCQRKKRSNRITMKKRLHLKHRKAA